MPDLVMKPTLHVLGLLPTGCGICFDQQLICGVISPITMLQVHEYNNKWVVNLRAKPCKIIPNNTFTKLFWLSLLVTWGSLGLQVLLRKGRMLPQGTH